MPAVHPDNNAAYLQMNGGDESDDDEDGAAEKGSEEAIADTVRNYPSLFQPCMQGCKCRYAVGLQLLTLHSAYPLV